MPMQYALHIAAGCGDDAEVVRLLTQKPALACERDDLMRTPLHYAAARKNDLRPCTPVPVDFYLRIIDHLINAGANLNLSGSSWKNSSALCWSCRMESWT